MSTGILGYIAIMAIFFLAGILLEEYLEKRKEIAVKRASSLSHKNAALY